MSGRGAAACEGVSPVGGGGAAVCVLGGGSCTTTTTTQTWLYKSRPDFVALGVAPGLKMCQFVCVPSLPNFKEEAITKTKLTIKTWNRTGVNPSRSNCLQSKNSQKYLLDCQGHVSVASKCNKILFYFWTVPDKLPILFQQGQQKFESVGRNGILLQKNLFIPGTKMSVLRHKLHSQHSCAHEVQSTQQ